MYRFGISSGLIRNYCRNPDPVAAPYCYTMDPNVRWEYCNLTQCSNAEGTAVTPLTVTPVPSLEAPSEQAPTEQRPGVQECYHGNGQTYRGTYFITVTGRTCQAWSSMTPHSHSRTPENYPNGGLIRNYCRNPDPVAAPYCYTMDPNVRWEYCNLTQCSDAEGTAVTPLTVTPVPSLEAPSEQGKEPVARHLHRMSGAPTYCPTSCDMYRFGISSGLIRNYCRNPDPVTAPYCYTMDPNVRWEYCNLTQCSDAEGTAVAPPTVTPVPSLEAPSEQAPTEQRPGVQECYHGNGQSYRGTYFTTVTGRTCQAWSSMTPHSHSRTPENYPNGYVFVLYRKRRKGQLNLISSVFLSAPTEQRPGVQECYHGFPLSSKGIMASHVSLFSEILSLISSVFLSAPTEQRPGVQECYHGNGQSYRGTYFTTVTGRTCQAWSSMTPHSHSRTPENYPNG
uniref:Kringle domain-containing protein n=1 Tax=Mandrillus leucophaeus TaxID=9568 RepID=A0A2K5Y0P2_MANLE